MGTGDRAYIYGDSNGALCDKRQSDEADTTFWDSRVEVSGSPGRTVQVGIVPPSKEQSTNQTGVWDSADGLFLQLGRSGLNRLIRALKEQGENVFGRDEW